ncbi:cytochrome C oxidase Cbb3 [Paramesorhizobium deserti]|uniref:Cytochrome C oxidase Cbb3 n=1 Tax=Paramesorhizobium deserti TaxID=1494590 RepID=A0A135HPT9_9HYPH|nr:cbb3-type cytochrome oxidase assembly protein CcoS [Paramesorhizobium deserti]KXF75123.1 cytochrome C oxidase Cbb3 [Paramesorhizobium deserti]
MTNLVVLIPIALFLGVLGLVAFLWSLKNGQYDDLDGAAERILLDDPAEKTSDAVYRGTMKLDNRLPAGE